MFLLSILTRYTSFVILSYFIGCCLYDTRRSYLSFPFTYYISYNFIVFNLELRILINNLLLSIRFLASCTNATSFDSSWAFITGWRLYNWRVKSESFKAYLNFFIDE